MNGLLILWEQAMVVQKNYRMRNSSEIGEFGGFQDE